MKKRIQGLSFLFAFILMIVSAAGCSGGKSFPADESAGSSTGEGTISGEEPEQPEKKVTLREIGKTWDALGEFSQDLCPAKDSESGRWGFVDKTGQWIIDPQYHDAKSMKSMKIILIFSK